MPTSHLLARAVIRDGDHVLVAQADGQPHTFLPGGHREAGEGLEACLRRELHEELGVEARVGPYRGAVEHRWQRDGEWQYELNHCFSVTVPTLTPDRTPQSREAFLSFAWAPVDRLAQVTLEPAPLRSLLTGDLDAEAPWWASTLEPDAPDWSRASQGDPQSH